MAAVPIPKEVPIPKITKKFIDFCKTVSSQRPRTFEQTYKDGIFEFFGELTLGDKTLEKGIAPGLLNSDITIIITDEIKTTMLLKSGISVKRLEQMKDIFINKVNELVFNKDQVLPLNGPQNAKQAFEQTWVNDVLNQMIEIDNATKDLNDIDEEFITDSQQVEDPPNSDYILESTRELLETKLKEKVVEGQRMRERGRERGGAGE